MAERKGSGGESDERDSVESGQQDDRACVDPEREPTPGSTAGDETQLTDNENNEPTGDDSDGETGVPGSAPASAESEPDRSAEAETPEQDTVADDRDPVGESSGDEVAEVITFRRRGIDSSGEVEPSGQEVPGEDDSDDSDAEPLDLSAVQADDELLDALGGTDPEVGATGGQRPDLEALLMSWRRDVDAVGMDDIVDVDAAVTAVEQGRERPRRRKRRHLVPVATAAAVLMITFTGVGLAARDAMPGDALWGVAQVLYTDHARSAKAASLAEEQLEKASTAWKNGRHEAAQQALQRAQERIQRVDPDYGLSDLKATHKSLSAKFERVGEPPESSSPNPTSTSESVPTSRPSQRPTGTSQPPSSSSSSPTTSPSSPSTSQQRPSDPSTTPRPTSGRGSGVSDSSTTSGTSGRSGTEKSGLLPP